MNPLPRLLALACLLAAAVSSGLCAAQGLPDPTRPPDAVAAPAAGGDGQAGASGLQTIIRRQGAKPAAVIYGEYVELGGKVGESRLVKVGEDSVVLQGPGGKEELKLIPAVDKRPAQPPAPVKKLKKAKKAKAGQGQASNGNEAKNDH